MSLRHERVVFERAREDASAQVSSLLQDQLLGIGTKEGLYNTLPELVAIELLRSDEFIGGTVEMRRSPELFAGALTRAIENSDPAELETWFYRAARLVQLLLQKKHSHDIVSEADAIEAYFAELVPSSRLADRTRVLHAVAMIKDAWAERNRLGNSDMPDSIEHEMRVCIGLVDSMSAAAGAGQWQRNAADPIYRLALRAAMQASGPHGIDRPALYERLSGLWNRMSPGGPIGGN